MKSKTSILIFIFYFFSSSFLLAGNGNIPEWVALQKGIGFSDFRTVTPSGATVHLLLYRVDPQKKRFGFVQAGDYQQKRMSAKQFVERSGAALAINAGFFDKDDQPLGLIVQNGKLLQSIRPVSWWGIFALDKNGVPHIYSYSSFKMNSDLQLAVQTGPRLIEKGKTLKLKPNFSEKSFVGIDAKGRVVVGVTDSTPIEASDLAKILSNEIQLKEALNLDGGSSTQIYAKFDSHVKEVIGWNRVVNALVLFKN